MPELPGEHPAEPGPVRWQAERVRQVAVFPRGQVGSEMDAVVVPARVRRPVISDWYTVRPSGWNEMRERSGPAVMFDSVAPRTVRAVIFPLGP